MLNASHRAAAAAAQPAWHVVRHWQILDDPFGGEVIEAILVALCRSSLETSLRNTGQESVLRLRSKEAFHEIHQLLGPAYDQLRHWRVAKALLACSIRDILRLWFERQNARNSPSRRHPLAKQSFSPSSSSAVRPFEPSLMVEAENAGHRYTRPQHAAQDCNSRLVWYISPLMPGFVHQH